MFGPTASEINQANQAHAVNHITLLSLLLDKGIVTADEVAAAQIKATHIVEQEWARKKEEAAREFDEQFPGLKKICPMLFGDGE